MSNAESRYADPFRIGVSTQPTSSTGARVASAFRGAFDGSGAPAGRLAALLGLVALIALALGAFASPASAIYLHNERPSSSFGPDGTSNFSLDNSFYDNTINDMALDSARHHLYVLHWREPLGANEVPYEAGAARGIFGFDISNPSNPKPLGGHFPLSIPEQKNPYSWLAVNEETGVLYELEKAQECYCEPGGILTAWNAEGKELPGFPVHIDKFGPMAVDPAGYIWVWREQNSSAVNNNLEKFLPDGTFVEEFEPKLSEFVGYPRTLTFDPRTGDLWLQYTEDVIKFTKETNYAYHEPPVPTGWTESTRDVGLGVDAANGLLYSVRSSYEGDGIEALNVEGGLAEDTFGLSGMNEYNYEKCQGQCYGEPPENRFTAHAYDPATGDMYVANDGNGKERNEQSEAAKGGRIEVFPGIGASDAHTGQPSAVGKTDATLTGRVSPGEGPSVTACKFQYVTDTSFKNVRVVSIAGATGGFLKFSSAQKSIPYNATAFEVEHSWEYSRPHVTGPAGGPWRIETNSEELGRIESKAIVSADELKPVGTKVHVDWDASTAECEPAASGGSPFAAPTDVEAHLTGLTTGTTYHYRVAATSAPGTVWGAEETFTTTFSKVSTGPATEIEREAATLNGTVDPEGVSTTYYFEYGRTPAYGSTTAAPPGENLGTTTAGDQPVSVPISGLEPGKVYHYRIVAVNSNGTSKGLDRTFNTVGAVKDLETEPATEVQRAQAMLHGKLDPDGLETHYYFEWGTSQRYGETSAAAPGTNLPNTSPGEQQVGFLATNLRAGQIYHYRLVATSSFGTTYGNDQTFTTRTAVIGLVTKPATEVGTEKATLNGELDPDGIPTTYYFEWGKSVSYGQVAPVPPGVSVSDSSPGAKPVSYVLENLEPGTTYHYRIVAVNATGETIDGDQTFTTKHAPSIEGMYTDHVTAESAELKARINPHGYATEWFFEYGLTTSYGTVVPVPHETLEPSTSGQPVSVALSGLQDATYHFRLVAKSEWGTVASDDQTFEYAPPVCPNTTLRQQTGANYLPDCRAYELVTPARAGGAPILPAAPSSPVAGDHVGFSSLFNIIPGSEAPNAGRGFPHEDFYVASRTQNGWETHYVGVKGNETLESKEILWQIPQTFDWGLPSDERLERFLSWSQRFPCCSDNGSYSPYLWDAEGHFLGRLPTNAKEVPGATTLAAPEGGFRGDGKLSGDGNHYVFSSIGMAFAPGGLTLPPGSAYDNNISTGSIEKISLNEAGEDIQADPRGIPSQDFGNTKETFIKFLSVSSDASHVLMSTPGPREGTCTYACSNKTLTVHLYMHVRGKGTYDVTKDFNGVNQGVHYVGTAKGGSIVYFTTYLPMTEDDHDQSIDLFAWNESTNELTRLSAGNNGTGNSDGCGGSWTSHCGIEVVPIEESKTNCAENSDGGGAECRDDQIAEETGEIYFYSPEQLDGAKGVPSLRNLYVWRNGAARFVATFEESAGAERINVSPDGHWMGFVTRSPITSYDNAGYAEMYTYDVPTGVIRCASCRPDGQPPTSDVKGSINGRFMTNDGRAFFSTREPLVNRDADGVIDTYEYVDGRPQLISNGAEGQEGTLFHPLGLLGVTGDGQNAFFLTEQSLVGQDENGLFLKIYDARVNGGFPFERPAAPCAAADECHGEGNPTPAPPDIGSSAGLGMRGNFTAPQANHRKKHRRHKHHRPHRGKTGRHAKKGARR